MAENKKNLLEETKAKMSLDDLFNQIQEGNLKELALVVKADVQGSVEAVKQSLVKLSNEEVAVRVIHGGVGAINESDVMLATASSAIIIGFNVRPDANAKSMAEQNGVDIRLYRVIYQAIEDVEAAMKGMLEPVYEEKVIGHAEVRQLFKHPVSERSPEAMYWTERSREAAKFESAAKETRSSKEIWHPSNVSKTMSKKCAPAMSAVLYLKDSTIFRSSIRSRLYHGRSAR